MVPHLRRVPCAATCSQGFTIVPLNYLPYFSHCTGGVRIGLPPSGETGKHNYANDQNTPFSIGYPDLKGGSPVRRPGNRVKCVCGTQTSYEEVCPPEGRTCNTVLDAYTGEPMRELDMTTIVKDGLPAGSDEYHFLPMVDVDEDKALPDLRVSPQCSACIAAGYPAGDPYPALHRGADGRVVRLPGWDSHVPIFYVMEHPAACHLVPDEEVVHIGEWSWGASARYSDACDYVMQCMYEENSLLAQDKP
jgi:hypothetical protein